MREAITAGLVGHAPDHIFGDELAHASNAALRLFHAGRLEETEAAARDLLVRFPDMPDGWEYLGLVHEKRDERRCRRLLSPRAQTRPPSSRGLRAGLRAAVRRPDRQARPESYSLNRSSFALGDGSSRARITNRDPERRRRWTTAEKLRIVEESFSCGLSAADFARQRDIHPNLLHSWRRRVKAGELPSPDGEARFAPVAVAAQSNAAMTPESDAGAGARLEVVLRNGRVLRLPNCAVPARVAQLADALEGGLR